MAKIYAPNKNYTGISASVPFVNGASETDKPNLIDWFKEHGYAVGEESKVVQEIVQEIVQEEVVSNLEITNNLEDMTKDELKELADESSIPYNSKTTKEDLVNALKAKEA